MYNRLKHIAKADRQDSYQRSQVYGHGSCSVNNGYYGKEVSKYVTAKFEPKKVGNLERTHRIVRANDRREGIEEKMMSIAAKVTRSANQRENRRAKRA